MKQTKFDKLSSSISKKQGLPKKAADAIAAKIGMNKYGKKEFQAMAKKGKSKTK